MPSDLDTFLQYCTAQVDAQLERIIPPATGPAAQLYEAIRYSVFNGGKRMRPALCFGAAEALATSDANTAKVAATLEMVHAYSLIHDDLPAMDNDDLRRGVPTCHIQFDEATAILAGDALHALAFKQLTELTDVSAEINLRLVATLSDLAGCNGMVSGQMIDLAATGKQLDIEQLTYMHQQKTGALIEASVLIGALATGVASEEQLDGLSQYARAIGLAFQIQDDILDVESSTQALGKHQGSDSHNQKATYTSILGVDKARAETQRLYKLSAEALEPFAHRADTLHKVAKFMVQRSY